MFQQLWYFLKDYKRLCGKKRGRFLYVWLGRVTIGVLVYRLERGMFLSLGRIWPIIRIIFLPVLNLMYSYSNCEINYRANVGPGILILHAAPGVVISGRSIIGSNLTLVGGNILGSRAGTHTGNFIIGVNCMVGANAVILGPINLGNNIIIGACALVINDFSNDITLVGNPAKPINLK